MFLKRLLIAPLVFAKHGSLQPNSITLPGRSHRIAINPRDNRAYKKLVMDTARGRVSIPAQFWHDHIEKIQPSISLDIGANYGECFSYGRYPATAKCLVIEANPILKPFLEKTRISHPDAAQITIESCLLGDQDHQDAKLYFAQDWTGGGSGAKNDKHNTEAAVTTRTMNSLLVQHNVDMRAALLMKMDVEGYEGKVISGFSSLFGRPKAAGILEFDTRMLNRAGTKASELFDTLEKYFKVYLTGSKSKTLQHIPSWTALTEHFNNRDFHCDLAFFTNPSLISEHWTATDLAPADRAS